MRAELEITGGVIRVFADDAVFGDPFEFSVYFIGDEKIATLKGLVMNDFTLEHASTVLACLKEHGFTHAIWHRWKEIDGVLTRKEVKRKL